MNLSSSSREGQKPLFILPVIVFAAIFMAVVDGSVVNIALPTITDYFGVNVTLSQWIVTGYLVTMTSLLLVFGRISEFIGRRRVFILGFLVFTLASLACGLSQDLMQLILFRVIQAIGASMLFSISGAIIFSLYQKSERGKAMGYVGATVAVGSIAGPVLGGFLVDTLGWEYIFLINVPIGALFIPLAMKYLRKEGQDIKPVRMDWAGAAAMVTCMVSLMFMLSAFAGEHAVSLAVTGFAMVFLCSLGAFILIERRVSEPLLDLPIFRVYPFSLSIFATFLYFIAIFMINMAGPFYFEGVYGLSPSQVGIVYLVIPLIMVVGSPLAGWLYDRHYSPYYPMAGMTLAGFSIIALAIMASSGDLVLVIAAFFPMAVGFALFQSPNNTEVMSALPAEKVSIASSVSATARNLGMAIGASFASILLVMSAQASGYTGPLTGAGNDILTSALVIVMCIAGALCLFAAWVSLARARVDEKRQHPE
jgi:drug resistance transporter, EmrB/QacA subfamily